MTESIFPPVPAQHVVSHLTPARWQAVNRSLLRKAISEFAHEWLLEPELSGPGVQPGFDAYRLVIGEGVEYHFEAQIMAMRHWRIPEDSITKRKNGQSAPLDALQFIIEIRDKLGMPDDRLPIYLDEISSTLNGSVYKRFGDYRPAMELALADYQTIETSMTEGHPGFVANNGRVGFDAGEYHAYAPEAAAPVQLMWLAVHKDHAHFACLSSMSYTQLVNEELGDLTIADFARTLKDQGLDPDHYCLMPAHPWQWLNKLAVAFAGYVAERKIVCLGLGKDTYLAQQSIRTFFNITDTSKRYVKTSLSILNMGFMRGLSPYYMSGTPAINEYIHGLIAADPWLRANGFTILREVASIGFRNRYYEEAVSVDSPYKKMFSALWRENPLALIGADQRLMTMAALLHVDPDGQALLPVLIQKSGLDATTWMGRYVDAYLTPLVHCFYAHDLVFMPHGENVILVIENHVPVRAFMKDIAEESSILDPSVQLPEKASRLAAVVPEAFKLLTIFVDVFEGYFRHLAHLLVEHGVLSETAFWQVVANRIADYQAAHPERLDKYRQYDLFAPDMIHSCLNRLQIRNNLQMVNLADPIGSFQMAPRLVNPIAAYRPLWLDPAELPAREVEPV